MSMPPITTFGPDGEVVAFQPGVEPAQHVPDPPSDAEIEAARLFLAAATTVSQTKTRALALDDLRAAQIAALTT